MKFIVTGVSMFNYFIPTLTEHGNIFTFALNIVINHLLTNTVMFRDP
jgi:hypothetical protein